MVHRLLLYLRLVEGDTVSWSSVGLLLSLTAALCRPHWVPFACLGVFAAVYVAEAVLEHFRARRSMDFGELAERLVALEAQKSDIARVKNKLGMS